MSLAGTPSAPVASEASGAAREIEEQDDARTDPERGQHDHPQLELCGLRERELNRDQSLVQSDRGHDEPNEGKDDENGDYGSDSHGLVLV